MGDVRGRVTTAVSDSTAASMEGQEGGGRSLKRLIMLYPLGYQEKEIGARAQSTPLPVPNAMIWKPGVETGVMPSASP